MNEEFKLVVLCNLYSIFNCIRILKSCKPKLYCSLNDSADFCTICHKLDQIMMDKISNSLKFFINNACRPAILSDVILWP